MRKLIFLLFVLWTWSSYALFDPLYTSPQQIVLNASTDEGRVFVPKNTDPAEYRSLILSQLRFSIGQLGWFGSILQYSWLEIQIGEVTEETPELLLVRYSVQGRIAWSRDELRPDTFEMILPARGDRAGLQKFYKTYGTRCRDDDLSTPEEFFYYFYPLSETCPLNREQASEKHQAVRARWSLEVHPDNFSERYPEYDQIWSDRRLDMTVLFSKNKSGSTSNNDAGIKSYNNTYLKLVRKFGKPDFISHKFTGVPGVRFPVLKVQFNIPEGLLTVHLRLVDTIAGTDAEFIKWYEDRTFDSDAIMYNGHSGLGINIEKIATLGKFKSGKYQIFFLNGCGTFAYFSEDLFKRHGLVNPGSAPSKHLDVMTNAFSSYFSQNPDATLTFIVSLIDQKENYMSMMKKIDPRQRILVDGEIDNFWKP